MMLGSQRKTDNDQYLLDNMKPILPSIAYLFLLNVGLPTEAEGML